MLTFLSYTLIYSIELVSACFILCNITNIKILPNIRFVASTLLFAMVNSLIELYVPGVYPVVILQHLSIFFYFSIYQWVKPQKLIYPYIGTYVIETVIQILTFIPCQMLGLPVEQTYMQLIGIFLTLLLCIACYFFVPLHKLYNFIFHTSVLTQLILSNLFLLCGSLVLYYHFNPAPSLKTGLLFIAALLLSIAVNWELLSANLKLHQKQNELENYQQYLPIIEELIEQVRIRQHKFDNEIQTICSLPLIHNNYDRLVNAINEHSKLCFEEKLPISFLKLNKKLLAAYFYQKTISAQEQGITLHLEIKNYNLQTTIPEYELLELFGILLDNAIEATPEQECIYMTLDSHNGTMQFSVANPSPPLDADFQKKIFKKGFTTKTLQPELHGLGLYILKQKITSYNGKIELQNITKEQKNYFSIAIHL